MENKKIYFVFFILAIGGLIIGIKYDKIAFPEASMEMNFDKSYALETTENYLIKNGFDISEYKNSVVFVPNSWDLLFLERSLGLKEANNMVEAKDVSIWNWEVRYFQQ